MSENKLKPCPFCGKKLEQAHTYPKFDNGTVYGCQLVHNCESGIRIHIKSTRHYKSKEEALRKFIENFNGEKNFVGG